MRLSSNPFFVAFTAFGIGIAPAAARTLRVDAAKVEAPRVSLSGLHVEAHLADVAGSLRLEVARLSVPVVALDGRVQWQCELRRDGDAQVCEGPVRVGDSREATLSARVTRDAIALALGKDDTKASVDLPLAAGAVTASVRKLPASWVAPLVAANWPGGDLRGGDIDVDADFGAQHGLRLRYDVRGLDLVTRDGAFAVDGVDASGTLDLGADSTTIDAQARLAHGRLDVGVLHAQLPDDQVEAEFRGSRGSDGVWQIEHLAWRDPAALEFDASAVFDPASVAPLRALSVRSAHVVFPLATARYAQGVFAAHGFDRLALDGELRGSVEVDARGLARLVTATNKLDVRDPARGIAVRGLQGGIDWRREGAGEAQPLAWRDARIAGWSIGALRSRWHSRDGALAGSLDAKLFGGTLRGSDVVLREPGSTGDWLRGKFSLHDMHYDSADGSLAAANVGAEATLRVSGALATPHLVADATLRGGQYLAGSAYVELPATPVGARLDATFDADRWHIASFEWNDPGVLEASASGDWQAALPAFPKLRVDLRRADLARALARYAQSWLGTRGYRDLAANGELRGAFALEAGHVRELSFHAHDVSVVDGAGRFELHGLDGALDWSASEARPPTTFGWQRIELYKVPFGAAQAHVASDTDSLRLSQPLAVDVFGGQLRLEKFIAQPASPRGDRYEASFAVVGVQLPQMSAAFGWPIFPGNLSGGIPEIEFVGDRIDFHGGLDLYLFDGHLGVNSMSLERPFGAAPALGANIHFENFDLQQVTSAFSFGGMSGRLFGTIDGLRLLDWSTVAFDAWLRTNGGGRMSYKAVDDITGIGSGAPPLQTLALKLVNTFGFGKLGLRCRLRDEVCLMGGIEPLPNDIPADDSLAARGYAIVEGAGIPRIDIVGHRRRVDWPTLVRRLLEATQGQAPVIK